MRSRNLLQAGLYPPHYSRYLARRHSFLAELSSIREERARRSSGLQPRTSLECGQKQNPTLSWWRERCESVSKRRGDLVKAVRRGLRGVDMAMLRDTFVLQSLAKRRRVGPSKPETQTVR